MNEFLIISVAVIILSVGITMFIAEFIYRGKHDDKLKKYLK